MSPLVGRRSVAVPLPARLWGTHYAPAFAWAFPTPAVAVAYRETGACMAISTPPTISQHVCWQCLGGASIGPQPCGGVWTRRACPIVASTRLPAKAAVQHIKCGLSKLQCHDIVPTLCELWRPASPKHFVPRFAVHHVVGIAVSVESCMGRFSLPLAECRAIIREPMTDASGFALHT